MILFEKNLKKAIYFLVPFIIYEILRECIYVLVQSIWPASSDSFKLLFAGIITLQVMIWMYLKERLPDKRANISKKNSGWQVMLCGCLLGCFMGLFFSFLATFFSAENLSVSYRIITQSLFSGEVWMQLFGVGIIIPIAEEMTFRGLVYIRAKSVFSNTIVAALFSSVLFGLFHGNIVQMIVAFLSGCVMCLLYERSGGVLATVLFHIGFNLPSVILKNTGFYIASRQTLGLLTLLSGVICAAGVVFLIVHKAVAKS